MNQQEIDYIDIVEAGFTEEHTYDKVYENKFGFPYCIIQKKIAENIYLEWAKETRLCKVNRIDDEENIIATEPVKNLHHMKSIINFFTDKQL